MLGLLMLAEPAHAGITIIADAAVPTYRVKDFRTDIDIPWGESSLELSQSANSVYSGGYSYGYAQPGVLKAYAEASSGAELGGSASASATALWSFSATLSNAALNGSKGQLTVLGHYDYSADILTGPYPGDDEPAASSHFQFDSIIGARTSLGLSYADYYESTWRDNQGNGMTIISHLVDDAKGERQVAANKKQELVIDFIWGEPILFRQEVGTSCSVWQSGVDGSAASCALDSTHSSYWGGIANVTADGLAVADYTIVTDAGIDLRQSLLPVPEPHTWGMLLLGGLLIAGARFGARARQEALVAC